jgi:hypothetical protein
MSFQQKIRDPFHSDKIVAHFKALKEQSLETNEEKWWKDFLQINWVPKGKKDKNNTTNVKWFSINYRSSVDETFRNLIVTMRGETHRGYIMPKKITPEELENSSLKNILNSKYKELKPRELKASIQIKKWSQNPETYEKSLEVKTYPDDKYKSVYFQLIEYLEEIITTELKERITRGHMLAAKCENKPSDNINSLQEIKKLIGHEKLGDTLVSQSELKLITKTFKKTFETNLFIYEIIEYYNERIVELIQRCISNKSAENPGKELPNPITRITIPFDIKTGNLLDNLVIFDKTTAEKINDKLIFHKYKVNGEEITDNNIHEVILPGTKIDGYVILDSLCISNMGLSVVAKAIKALFIEQPQKINQDVSDDYNFIHCYENNSVNEIKNTTNEINKESEINNEIENELIS